MTANFDKPMGGEIATLNDQIGNPFPNTLVSSTVVYNSSPTWTNNSGHIALLVLNHKMYTLGKKVSVSISGVGTIFSRTHHIADTVIEETNSMLIPNGATVTITYEATSYQGSYAIYGIS